MYLARHKKIDMTKLEIACFNEAAALTAAQAGADRIELCEDYSLGGISPSVALLKKLKAQTNFPVNVMIRPRGGDFCYTDVEFEAMKADITALKAAGADGFVFGILTSEGVVNVAQNKTLVDMTEGMPCTFHRAFDGLADKSAGLEDVISCGFTTILTSGGEHPAVEGISTLKALKTQAGDRLTILVGGGVRSFNAAQFTADFDYVHSACIKPGTEEIDLKELAALKAELV